MPYTANGDWVVSRINSGPCSCPPCRELSRLGINLDEVPLTEPEYGEDGFDQFGYNRRGRDREGFDREGFDRQGFDHEGFDYDGYNREGFNREGYDPAGRDREGYDYHGFDANGRDREGYDEDGRDREGYDPGGFNYSGYNREGRDRNGYNREGWDREGFDRDGYDEKGRDRQGNEKPCDCADCRISEGTMAAVPDLSIEDFDLEESWSWGENTDALHYYSYTPSPLTFRRNHGENPRKVPFYGMEIEMTSEVTKPEMMIGTELGLGGDLLYFKQDGSVDGFEMVTHPMTEAWAQEHFPWHVVEMLGEAGASVDPSENGLHIHVSRSGFNDVAHQHRWMKFFYRNEENITEHAGRANSSWGRFDSRTRETQFRHLKSLSRQNRGFPVMDGEMQRFETREAPFAGARHSALNCNNMKTIEVRIFAATTRPTVLRKRFELVAATVEYTRDLKVSDIRNGGWTWDSFLLWLDNNKERYARLAQSEAGNITVAIASQAARDAAAQPAVLLS